MICVIVDTKGVYRANAYVARLPLAARRRSTSTAKRMWRNDTSRNTSGKLQ